MISPFSQNIRSGSFYLQMYAALLFIVLVLNLFYCPVVHAGDPIIVAVTLNTEAKTDVFALLEEDGDFLLRTVDLTDMGILQIDGQRFVIDDEEYVSLRSMVGVAYIFQEASLTLEITVAPELLPVAIFDMQQRQTEQVIYTRDDSLFFNYGLDYDGGTADNGIDNDSGFNYRSFNVSNELGIRKKNILFYTDTIYIDTPDDNSFIRLNTNFTYDQRDEMRRIVVGDYRAFSGELGSRINFAGISVSKNYDIDPYFLETPFFNYSGVLSLPSEVTVYSDGVRLRSQKLNPGRFDIQNFYNTGGAQEIELEVTDSLGRVQRIYTPFYFSNSLLRKGLSEYSYNLGAIRRDYGTEDSRYTKAVFSARHRYAFTDKLNLGYRSEGSSDLLNLGADALYGFHRYGVVGLDLSASTDDDGSGWASYFRYEYRDRKYSARFAWRQFSDNYQTLQRQETKDDRKSDIRVGLGYVARKLGSLSLDLGRSEFKQSDAENLVLVSYSRRLNSKMSVNGNFRYIDSEQSRTEVFINLSYYFDNDHTLNSSVRVADDGNSQQIEASKDVPTGEGWGWWTYLERENSDESSEVYTVLPGVQWNSPYGIYRGEVNLNSDDQSVRLAASGAVVAIGGKYGFTRPVRDSFGVVQVGDVEGVKVYSDSQLMGTTDAEGKVFAPELTSFYYNRISIEDEDIPIDYLMPQIEKVISPPFRSGSCVSFPVEKYRAFTGTLIGTIGGEQRPLEYYEGEFYAAQKMISFYTGSGGEFYFDNDSETLENSGGVTATEGCAAMVSPTTEIFTPGDYSGQASSDIGEICRFDVTLPETDERYFDLGEIICQPIVDNEAATDKRPEPEPVTETELPPEPVLETELQPEPVVEDEIQLKPETIPEMSAEEEIFEDPDRIIFSPKALMDSLAPDAETREKSDVE